MSFQVTEEQEQLRALVADLLSTHGSARLAYDGGPARDLELWKRMGELGLTYLGLDESLGGSGGSAMDETIVAEEVGRVTAMVPIVTSSLAASVRNATGGEPVPIDGEVVLVAVSAKRGLALDVTALADPTAETWRLTGAVHDLIEGAAADTFFVPVGRDWFRVSRDAPGVALVDQPSLDPTQRLGSLSMDGAVATRIGTTTTATLDEQTQKAWVLLAAQATGAAARALEITVEYSKQRHAFGQPIGRFQAIKHRVSEMLIAVENARSATYNAAWAIDERRGDAARAARMAKAVATENAVNVIHDAIQSHGGIGFTWEYDLHLYLRRAKSAQLALGDPEHHFAKLGEALLSERA